MKAKEYARQFIEIVSSGDAGTEEAIQASLVKAAQQVVGAILRESATIADLRGVQTPHASYSIIKEQNKKYQALRRELEKHYGTPVLTENGYKELHLLEFQFLNIPDWVWKP